MNKTNLILLLAAAALGALCWSTWQSAARADAAPTEADTGSSYRRYVVDIPRVGAVPSLNEVRGIRIVAPRVEKAAELDAASNLEREKLEGELAKVLWDLLPPARRAEHHEVSGEPQWHALKAAPILRALLERCAGLVADPQKQLKAPNASSWCEFEAHAANPALQERTLRQVGQQLVTVNVPRLLNVGVGLLNRVENDVANMQRGRPGGAAAPVTLGELQGQSTQNTRDLLIDVLAKTEDILAPWRRPLRHMERLLAGEPRHGFTGFDEEAWVGEIEERVQRLLELARAEALDHPNPEEYERRGRTVVDALTALSAKLPAWKERAQALGGERAALREAFAALSEAGRTLALDRFPPEQPQYIGYTLALPRAIQGGLPPEVKDFLVRAKAFADEALLPFYLDLRAGVAPLGALPKEIEAMLKSAPRDIALARGEDGAWRVTSEGDFPAHGERVDGVEIVPASPLRLSPLGGLRTLMDLARSEIARRQLAQGGARPESGPPPLLVALAELMASDPRGAWLPREREYGFDEKAVEIALEGAGGKVIERVRFGAPDAETANPPPWIEGKRKAELATRNMAYVHSFNSGRRLAYRVEWLPRVATVRPNQELRAQDFLFGDRRLVPASTPETIHSVSVAREGRELEVARDEVADGSPASWSLRSTETSAARMDEGLARRFLSQLSALFLDGVASRVEPTAESWKRFGFDAPRLVLEIRADAFSETLRFGARVRRDGKLFVACTAEGRGLGALVAGGRFAFLVEWAVFQRLAQGVDELVEEARLLAAGPLFDSDFLARVDRISITEGSTAGGPAPSLELMRKDGRWLLPAAGGHLVDPQRVDGGPKSLLDRLRALQRAYPFAGLTEGQRAELGQRLQSGTRLSLFAGEGESLVIELASDADATLGGERLANRRRSGGALQIARKSGEEEIFLVPALELPDLAPSSWLDLQWQRELEPIKQATSLQAGGVGLGGADVALSKSASGWTRGEGAAAVDAAHIDEALSWLENLGAIELQPASPEGSLWLRIAWNAGASERVLEIFRTGEGESVSYAARFPGRDAYYRVTPIVIDPLVTALKRLAAE